MAIPDVSSWFVEVPLETDEATLADDAIDVLQTEWEQWEPNDGDLEVVQIEALASIAAAVAAQASVGTEEIFRAFGTKLVGIPYPAGTPASGLVTFTLTDTELHIVPDGSEIDIDGLAFLTVGDAGNTLGDSLIANVPVEASEVGVLGNGLGETASRISALSFVADVTVLAPTAGGVDAMSDADYLGLLSRRLQLRADTLVTARDHEYWALAWPGVGRAFAEHTADRHVTIYIADDDGEPIDALVKAAMEADLVNYRLVNTITTLADPSYDLKLRIEAMLDAWLSPAGFAAPKFGDPGVVGTSFWVGTNIVRKNSAIDRIADVEGVDYVDDVTLLGGTPDGGGNLTMTGTIALPRYDATAGSGVVDGPL